MANEITVTTAANFIPELWAAETLRAFEAKLGLDDRVNRRFEKGLSFGDTI